MVVRKCKGPLGRKTGVCGRPAEPVPVRFTFYGQPSEMYLCPICKRRLDNFMLPFVERAVRVPMRMAEDHADFWGQVWTMDRIVYFLKMSGRDVSARGRLNETKHLSWWFDQTEEDRHLWEKVDAELRKAAIIAAGKENYELGDPRMVKAVNAMIKQMEEEGAL